MRQRSSSISVFSTSALDLFASALGAFLLIVLILFPYYQRGGVDTSMEELEDLVKKRREAADQAQTDLGAQEARHGIHHKARQKGPDPHGRQEHANDERKLPHRVAQQIA